MFSDFFQEICNTHGITPENIIEKMPDYKLTFDDIAQWSNTLSPKCRHSPLQYIRPLSNILAIPQSTLLWEILQDYSKDFAIIKENSCDYPDIIPLSSLSWNPLANIDPFWFAEQWQEFTGGTWITIRIILANILTILQLLDKYGENSQIWTGKKTWANFVNLYDLMFDNSGNCKIWLEKMPDKYRVLDEDRAKVKELKAWFKSYYYSSDSISYSQIIETPEIYSLLKLVRNPVLNQLVSDDKPVNCPRPMYRQLYSVPSNSDIHWIIKILCFFDKISFV